MHIPLETKFWETCTVILTIISAFLACGGFGFSFWEEKRTLFKRLDRAFSIAGAVAALLAGLTLGLFTHYNRRDEAQSDKKIVELEGEAQKAAEDAQNAIGGLDEAKKKLAITDQQLDETSRAATTDANRLRTALEQANQQSEVETLIQRMYADDATAFDQLRSRKTFSNPSQAQIVKDALRMVIDSHNALLYDGNGRHPFGAPQLLDSLTLFSFKDPEVRQMGLRELKRTGHVERRMLPKLVSLAVSDPSLDVRTLAVQVINICTLAHFPALDGADNLQKWWDSSGRKDYQSTPEHP